MTHLEIYNKLKALEEKLDDYLIENIAVNQDSVSELCRWIINGTAFAIVPQILVLETSEIFCAGCFYVNFNKNRKALHRYLLIETEIPERLKVLLKESKELFNEICMDFKKM